MSWQPSTDPELGDPKTCDALDLIIVPRTRDLGDGFAVRRALPHALATEFVRQHLMAIQRHSRHDVAYAAATFDCKADFPLELFDALIIHFSVRMPFETMSPSFVELVSGFRGPKVLLIQDEYDMPRKACALIRKLGIDTIFTTVPKPFVDQFYPPAEIPNVKLRPCLTGYVPDELPFELAKPLAERQVWLAYRGRKLPVWYGQLGFEKYTIAQRMKAECAARNIPHGATRSRSTIRPSRPAPT